MEIFFPAVEPRTSGVRQLIPERRGGANYNCNWRIADMDRRQSTLTVQVLPLNSSGGKMQRDLNAESELSSSDKEIQMVASILPDLQ